MCEGSRHGCGGVQPNDVYLTTLPRDEPMRKRRS